MGNFEGSNRSSRSCISTEKDDADQPRKIESRSPDGASKSGFVIRSCRKFTCPQDRPGISVRHGEARQPKADLAPLLKMRRATKIYQQYAGPALENIVYHSCARTKSGQLRASRALFLRHYIEVWVAAWHGCDPWSF